MPMPLASALISPVLIVLVASAILIVVALLAAGMVLSYRLGAGMPVQAARRKRRVATQPRRPRGASYTRSRVACPRGAREKWSTERARRSGSRYHPED